MEMEVSSHLDGFGREVSVIGDLLLNATIAPPPEGQHIFFWGKICSDAKGNLILEDISFSGGRINEDGRWLPIARQ
ncbi:MAG: hypothetical protein AAB461_03460 [Patescibacteria group bacterium]